MRKLLEIYEKLLRSFGEQGWWPADTKLEVIVGAVLTQNTNWKNVEKAIKNLKKERLLSWKRLLEINGEELARIIRPAGFYRLKA
ncbi:MAG: endonuclease, partial [Nanoarchaeota archaeon]|nr:endonuclease [Nanoarchaeota archaeon]